MFHINYRMAKAQQERMLAQAQKQGGRAQSPTRIVALVRRLTARRRKKAEVEPSHKPAEAKV